MWVELILAAGFMLVSSQNLMQSLQINKLTKRIAKLEGSK